MQTIAIIVSFPFFFIMIAMCISLVKVIRDERRNGATPMGDFRKDTAVDSDALDHEARR